MAVSRFLNVDWSQPISSFVPRPFEAALLAGKQAQEELDTKLKDLESSTDPFAKLNLTASLKVYDPNSPGGIRDYDLGSTFESKKNATVTALAQERQQIVDDYYNQKINQNEFNKRISQHKTKAKTAYNIFSSVGAAAEKIRKHNEEVVAKSKDFATTPYYGEELLSYNTDFVNKLQNNQIGDYVGVNIADKFESEKDLNEHAKGFEESGQGYAGTSGGYITDVQIKGVTGTKVYDYAKNIWDGSTRKIYADLKVKDYLARTGKTGQELVDHITYQRIPDKNGNIIEKEVKVKVPLYNALLDNEFTNFHNALADKVVHQTKAVHMKGDPFAVIDYKKKLVEDQLLAAPADVEADASVAYDAIPGQIKDFVDTTTGKFDINLATKQGKGFSYIIDESGKKYPIVSEITSYSGAPGSKPAVNYKLPDELKQQGYSIDNLTGKVYKGGKLAKNQIVGVKAGDPEFINKVNEDITKWAFDRGSQLGINPNANESKKAYADRVLQEVINKSKNVSVNKKIDADISVTMDNDLIGKDGSKFFVNYDDIIIPGQKGTKPVKEFIKDNNIDPSTIKHSSVTFDKEKPGYVLFSGLDKDKNPVQFYAKSRNLDFVKSTESVSNMINDFRSFYRGDIKSKNITIENKNYTVLDKKVSGAGKNENVFLALDENRIPVIVFENKSGKGPKYVDIPVNDLKDNAYKTYFESPEAKEYTRKIRESKNWQYKDLLTGGEEMMGND